jgi:type IV pilus assembly protein PilV
VPTAFSNNHGFTLIEVLVAMVVMMVGLVGLLQSINVATEHNIRNYLRDEAVRVGNEKMRDDVTLPFTAITSNTGAFTLTRKVRTGSKSFAVKRTVTGLPASSPTSKKIDIVISWSYKGTTYTHTLYRIVAQ